MALPKSPLVSAGKIATMSEITFFTINLSHLHFNCSLRPKLPRTHAGIQYNAKAKITVKRATGTQN